MTDEFENELADYLRGELTAEEEARMEAHLRRDREKQSLADDFRGLLALARQIAQDEPPEELMAQARQSVLQAIAHPAGQHLRLMMLQFQGSWGHGEICLLPRIHSEGGARLSAHRAGLLEPREDLQEPQEQIRQVPLLKLQIQGSWGHGEACLPDAAGHHPHF